MSWSPYLHKILCMILIQQVRYLDTLSEFNFQVIFQPGKTNKKADTLTQMFNSEEKNLAYQTILTPDCVEIWVREVEEGLFQQIHEVNKTDELCDEYCEAIVNNAVKLHSWHLHECWVIDSVLFKNNLLWISESLHIDLLQEIHDCDNHTWIIGWLEVLWSDEA